MNNAKLVAFAGHMGAGKDTAANYLVTQHGYTHFKFADPVYAMVAIILNCSRDEVELYKNHTANPIDPTYPPIRSMLEMAGTDFARNMISKEVWVRHMVSRINRFKRINRKSLQKFVISDLRFMEEKAMVEEFGGRVVIIERPDNQQVQSTHESNRIPLGLRNKSTIVRNDGNVAAFEQQIQEACNV